MSKPMQKRLREGLLVSACGSALLLGACGGNDSSPMPPTAANPTTATALAVSQINAQTCDNNDPQAVNSLSLSDDQDQTDVTMLTPGCAAP